MMRRFLHVLRGYKFSMAAIIIAAVFIAYPILSDKQIVKANDLSGNIANTEFLIKTLKETKQVPLWNSYVSQGVPLDADPLSSFYNPIVFFSFLFFRTDISLKIIYFLSIALSGIFFLGILRYVKVNSTVGLLISLSFMTSGYLAARIFAGHLEKILAYPLVPLILLSIFWSIKYPSIRKVCIVAILMALLLFSGSIYELLYLCIILFSFLIYFLIIFLFSKHKLRSDLNVIGTLVAVFPLFALFSAIKLFPVIEISPYVIHIKTPFLGSQSFLSIIENLYSPISNITRYIKSPQNNTPYPWWESFSFIGLVPLLTLLGLPFALSGKGTRELKLLTLITLVLLLFAMMGNPFNPFYQIFNSISFLQQFRIPSRVFIFLIPVVLCITGILLTKVYEKGTFFKLSIISVLLWNLFTCYSIFQGIISSKVPPYTPIVKDYQEVIRFLRNYDTSEYFIAQSYLFQNQLPANELTISKLRILNSNYGFALKGNKSLDYINMEFEKRQDYQGLYPKYFIFPKKTLPSSIFSYRKIYIGSNGSALFRNESYTSLGIIVSHPPSSFANLPKQGDLTDLKVGVNRIDVIAQSRNEKSQLLLLQSFSPSWEVNIDGKHAVLKPDTLLTTKMLIGKHHYTFQYNPKLTLIGLIISGLSFGLFFGYMIIPFLTRRCSMKKRLH